MQARSLLVQPFSLSWAVIPRRFARALLISAVAMLAAPPADSAAAETPAPSADKGPAPAQPARPAAVVDGFREAHFGMTEEQVRRAIRQDFPAAAAKLGIATHPIEKTTVLSVPVSNLLPGSGTAQVSYIIGYASRKLIQVNVLWTSDATEAGDEAVIGTANLLRDHFAEEAFKPDSVIANRQLPNKAILVFRGSDARDRMVLLVLGGTAAAARNHKRGPPPSPLRLELAYIAEPAHPDVYRVGKGQF